jgi:REP element-mobilizing transposase RayT
LPLAKTAGWGGKRPGAGRKQANRPTLVGHTTRPRVSRHTPVHVTMRVAPRVWNLRSKRGYRALRGALSVGGCRNRFGLRLCDFSIQGNHLHLLVEANDRESLSRGMQGLSIRVAKALNKLMGTKGKVLSDRFHAHVLRSPREVRRALTYVRENRDEHRRRSGQWMVGFADEFSSMHPGSQIELAEAMSFLLNQIYRELGPPMRPRPRV